jgi:hypothetical protein
MGLARMGAVTVGSPQAMPASRPLPDNPNRKAPLRFRTAILLLARTVDQPRHSIGKFAHCRGHVVKGAAAAVGEDDGVA